MPGNDDKWSQYEAKPQDKWDEFEVKPTPAVTEIERQAQDPSISSTLAKLVRGAELGTFQGLGIPETTNRMDIVKGAVGGAAKGMARLAGAGAEEVGSLFVDPFLPKEKRLNAQNDPMLAIGRDIVGGVTQAGGEALRGIKDQDPEQFAHGFGSMVTQLLMLKGGMDLEKPAVTERGRLAKTSAALDVGKGQIKDLKTAMPEVVKQAQAAGIDTVGDFGKTVKQARAQIDNEFNQGLAPIAQTRVIPQQIANRIRNLVTPDMMKAFNDYEAAKRAGRGALRRVSQDTKNIHDQVVELNKRAAEFQQPWTYEQLNARRATENQNLTSFYNKESRAQAASPIDTEISKAIRDGAADTVYTAWDRANPGKNAQALKARQGALWGLDDYVNHPEKGVIADLEAKQAQHEGRSFAEKVHARAAVHRGGVGAYLTLPVLEPFRKGPMEEANANMRAGFRGSKYPFGTRAAVAAAPIGVLAGRKLPFAGPPPVPDQDDQQ